MEEIRQKIRQLLEERQEDVKMISEMVNQNAVKSKQDVKTLQSGLENQLKIFKEEKQNEMKDFVRVDEVQGALRKLTESFKLSIQQIDELGAARLREVEERLG